ncbi:MAG TPA: hypothetical protein PLU43_12015, partial [Lachnospiraceae bacterium]|nr:hypothetical protein [Lachnospiraceae bacterium]
MNRHKRKAAIDLALLLTLSPAMNIYVSAASAAGISKTQEEETVTTGTQEAAKEKEADKKQEASENDEYADDEDTQEAAAEPVEWEDIQINSTADLVALSRSCWLDTWSKNKRVCLNCDLKLANSEFVSIPTFGGYFDGQGHTIEGLCVDDAVSYTGLFCYVQENAVITDLTVKGTVQPSGEQTAVGGIAGDNSGTIQNCKFDGIVEGSDYTGGIAGFNELTGSLVACTCSGYVTGTHYTGGIVGENMGNIMRCINTAEVNSSNVDKGMSLDDINLEQYTSNLFNLDAAGNDTDASEVVNSTVDTGGIPGQSIGV